MSGKRLLKNVLAHTGTQNKMQEEREMWRLRALERGSRWEEDRAYERHSMLTRGRLLSDTLTSPPPPSSDHHLHTSLDDHTPYKAKRRGKRTEGYWTRLLLKQEENDPSRWGHSGYKEVYAEEFASSESEDSDKDKGTVKRIKHKHRHRQADKNGAVGMTVKKLKKTGSEASGSDGAQRKRTSESESSDDEERGQRLNCKKRRGVEKWRRKEQRRRDKHHHKGSHCKKREEPLH